MKGITRAIKNIRRDTGFSRKDIVLIINLLTREIAECLKEEGRFILTDFGTFTKVHYTIGRTKNCQTGEFGKRDCTIVRFKKGKHLLKYLKN